MENEKIKYLLREIELNNHSKAYRELFNYCYKNLHRFAFSILKSKEDTEEVVSDFFISLWKKKNSLHEIENPKLFFFVSVKNLSINNNTSVTF